jgi:hypothetical protein
MENTQWKFFIGVGDGHEGFGGDWADFYKRKEEPDGASEFLIECTKEEFLEFVKNYHKMLDIGDDYEELINNDEEFYFTTNCEDDCMLSEYLEMFANEHGVEIPHICINCGNELDEDDCCPECDVDEDDDDICECCGDLNINCTCEDE